MFVSLTLMYLREKIIRYFFAIYWMHVKVNIYNKN